ncbi:MAG: hypothetical protein M3151_02115 [Actinomycetota bacterium]|nr:hypothetical protein [Actinomycetota bacterium]
MAAQVGEQAPDVTLPADDRENTFSLEEYLQLRRFEKGTWVLAIGADSPWSHGSFAAHREGIVRAERVESAPQDQPGVEATLEDPEKVL